MLIGVFMLIVGLGLAGFTLYQILGGIPDETKTRWYGIAAIGVFLSLIGLILTIRGMKAPSVALVPSPQKQTQTADQQPLLLQTETAPTPVQTAEEKCATTVPELVCRSQQVIKRQTQEDPNGKKYDKTDYDYFNSQVKLMNDGFAVLVKETMTGSPPPEKAHIPKIELWNNFNWNLNIYAGNLKMRSSQKNGPGTAEIKLRIFEIYDTMIKMEAVYHNAITANQEPDYAYISDLQSLIERHMKFIDDARKKNGIK